MNAPKWFHGGVAGLKSGDILTPSPPHVTDGCPVCVARAQGRVFTVGEFRAWATQLGERARPVLEAMEGAPDNAPLDPPSERSGVYITTEESYANWYAARSVGDLYEVKPIGELAWSDTDHFPSAVVQRARVVRVIRRGVRLTRRDRRAFLKEWKKADRAAERRAQARQEAAQ